MSNEIKLTDRGKANLARRVYEMSATDIVVLQDKKMITYADMLVQLTAAISAGSGKTMREILKQQILTDR